MSGTALPNYVSSIATTPPWYKFNLKHTGCAPLEIWQFGDEPKIIFYSGIHGDEHQPIQPLENTLNKILLSNPRSIGDCILIPRLHEEALTQGRRGYKDSEGIEHDLNRKFKYKSSEGKITNIPYPNELEYPKAIQLMKMISLFPSLEYLFSFHADNAELTKQLGPDNKIMDVENGAYIYDMPWYKEGENEDEIDIENTVMSCMNSLREKCKEDQIRLLNGWDDINDPDLRNYVVDGYVKTPVFNGVDGSFESYLAELGRLEVINIKRAFSFETPGYLEDEKKYKYIEDIFETFVIPFLNKQKN